MCRGIFQFCKYNIKTLTCQVKSMIREEKISQGAISPKLQSILLTSKNLQLSISYF